MQNPLFFIEITVQIIFFLLYKDEDLFLKINFLKVTLAYIGYTLGFCFVHIELIIRATICCSKRLKKLHLCASMSKHRFGRNGQNNRFQICGPEKISLLVAKLKKGLQVVIKGLRVTKISKTVGVALLISKKRSSCLNVYL